MALSQYLIICIDSIYSECNIATYASLKKQAFALAQIHIQYMYIVCVHNATIAFHFAVTLSFDSIPSTVCFKMQRVTIFTWRIQILMHLCLVSWEPEGRYHNSMMFCWEPEGCYCCTKSMTRAPFWFSTEHRWTVLTPFWFSVDTITNLCELFYVFLAVSWRGIKPCPMVRPSTQPTPPRWRGTPLTCGRMSSWWNRWAKTLSERRLRWSPSINQKVSVILGRCEIKDIG